MAEGGKITPISIEEEMKGAYIDYSMSVIISRALPDVRDGLKPVHRRVLYGMSELGVYYNRSYKKSARIVGEVLGKFHPHGDTSVYDSMVRMAQEWSLRYPLVDGQGNYGSIEGDPPAAMRYTEARLKQVAGEMLTDIDKNTVGFVPNFDDTLEEPSVLPAKLPNLLVNGTSGIAVGMATNMPPHNLTEVVDGIIAYIENSEITIRELMEFVKGPDFPTGGIIYGIEGVRDAFETGRGRVVVRAVAEVETLKTGRQQIVITQIPYMVNLAMLVEKAAALVNEKKVEGISDVLNLSDKNGIRVVFELKKDANAEVILNTLYKFTPLETAFNVNNVALVNGRPMTLNLKDLIHHYVHHRHEVVVRRTKFDLDAAEKRLHILDGLLIALDNLDAIIQLIRGSADPDAARQGLIEQFSLSELQAKAILDMRLQRLTGLERDKIQQEHNEVVKLIEQLKEILASQPLRMQIIKDELKDLKERYGDKRRTEIVFDAANLDIEDMIPNDDMVVTISNEGYIKRTLLREYRTQGRGGIGSRGVATKEDDYPEHLFTAANRDWLLIFTDFGKVYWLKTYKIPEGGKTSKGRPLQNLIMIEKEEKVRAVINVPTLNDEEYINNHFLMMCTRKGIIKKTTLEAYSRPRANGINAISVWEGDSLLDVKLTGGRHEIVISMNSGRAIRFNEDQVRPMGRNAAGVKGATLSRDNDFVVGLVCVEEQENSLLVISEKGYGKRSPISEYPMTNRGGKGVKTLQITEKTGSLIGSLNMSDDDEMMIITKAGIIMRTSMADIRVMGRATQGVRLIRLNEGDEIASVAKVVAIAEAKEEELLANPDADAQTDTGGEDTPAAATE